MVQMLHLMLVSETHDYAPHLLNAAKGRIGKGRQKRTHRSVQNLPWYTVHCFSQGNVKLHTPEGTISCPEKGVCIIPPNSEVQLRIPASCSYSWIDWGVNASFRTSRSPGSRALRYPNRTPQPGALEVWGQKLPLLLPPSLVESTHQAVRMMIGDWQAGTWARLRANATLGMWIADMLQRLSPKELQCDWIEGLPDGRARTYLIFAWERLSLISSVTAWAESVALSRHQLNRVLMQDVRCTASEALNHLRRERVQLLIASYDGEDGETWMGSMIGFSHPRSFTQWYQKQFGSPFGIQTMTRSD